MVELNTSGVTDLPPGKIASVVTYLEMTAPPETLQTPGRDDLQLVRIDDPDPDWYRAIYRAIGEDWLWFTRLKLSDEELSAILQAGTTELHALQYQGRDAGLFELDKSALPDIEVAFFGVTRELFGTGAGCWLMARGLEIAWNQSPERVWLHTCNLDHPAAVNFYKKCGFVPYKFAIDIDDDPRITGVLPETAAPHVPLLK